MLINVAFLSSKHARNVSDMKKRILIIIYYINYEDRFGVETQCLPVSTTDLRMGSILIRGRWMISFTFHLTFFTVAIRQSAALKSATQHAMLRKVERRERSVLPFSHFDTSGIKCKDNLN